MGSQRVGHDWATELNWIPLAGRFFTTESPGNPYHKCLNLFSFFVLLLFFTQFTPSMPAALWNCQSYSILGDIFAFWILILFLKYLTPQVILITSYSFSKYLKLPLFSCFFALVICSFCLLNMNYLCWNCSLPALVKALECVIHSLAAKWNLFKRLAFPFRPCTRDPFI